MVLNYLESVLLLFFIICQQGVVFFDESHTPLGCVVNNFQAPRDFKCSLVVISGIPCIRICLQEICCYVKTSAEVHGVCGHKIG